MPQNPGAWGHRDVVTHAYGRDDRRLRTCQRVDVVAGACRLVRCRLNDPLQPLHAVHEFQLECGVGYRNRGCNAAGELANSREHNMT